MDRRTLYHADRLVRFADCDPAGIVYFPRYFDFVHAAIEDWFQHALGINYWTMLEKQRIGLPAVRAECEFRRPARMGDRFAIAVAIERLGATSLTTHHAFICDGELRAEARLVQVAIPMGGSAAIPIPGELRTAMQAYAEACGPLDSTSSAGTR